MAANPGLAAPLRRAAAAEFRSVAGTAGTASCAYSEPRRLFAAELIFSLPVDYCATVAARMATSAVNSANPPNGTMTPARRFAVNTEATITKTATKGGP